MKNYYQLKFADDDGKSISLTVPNAKDITPALFTSSIENILGSSAIKSSNGIATTFVSAFFCTQTVTQLDVKNAV